MSLTYCLLTVQRQYVSRDIFLPTMLTMLKLIVRGQKARKCIYTVNDGQFYKVEDEKEVADVISSHMYFEKVVCCHFLTKMEKFCFSIRFTECCRIFAQPHINETANLSFSTWATDTSTRSQKPRWKHLRSREGIFTLVATAFESEWSQKLQQKHEIGKPRNQTAIYAHTGIKLLHSIRQMLNMCQCLFVSKHLGGQSQTTFRH